MKNNNGYNTATIVEVIDETPLVKSFIVDTTISAKPGQFIMVWIPGVHEKPFGVSAISPFMISVANVGPFSQLIHQLRPGDKLTWRGPYGNSFSLKGDTTVIVGGGYGVVPLYFLASVMPKNLRQKTTVIIGAKTKVQLPYIERFRSLGCQVKITTDDGSEGFKGFTTDVLQKILESETIDSIYTCGPEVMMKKVAYLASDHNVSCQVSLERVFKCGIGLCGECSCKGKLICKDGPVFPGEFLLD